MSDTEDGDNGNDGDDGFDKEAEREKLREQYEREQKRREATQQMSDLLLKGATMTNTHCDDCGSPIFRYEGETFCPTCAGTREMAGEGDEAGGGTDQSASAGQPDGQPAGAGQGTAGQRDADPGTAESQVTDAGGQAGEAPGRDTASPSSSPDLSGDAPAGSGSIDQSSDDGSTAPDDLDAMRSRLDQRVESRSPNAGGPERRSDPPRSTGSAVRSGEVPSMAQSRASLRRAIVSLSEQAAQSDDPGRAHDLLKGSREAAEALAALEGTTGE